MQEPRAKSQEQSNGALAFVKGASPLEALICVPTYNEAENIEPFINAVFNTMPACADVLVIDDNSPDGTAAIVENLIEQFPERLHLLKRPQKQGLGVAYRAAFEWGRTRNYRVFLEIDADFSHNPKYIPIMFAEIQTYDVIIGSRNIPKGGIEGWSAFRNFISKGGSLYARMVLGCPIKDLTGGFTMWTSTALEKIGLKNIVSNGYSFQVEIKYKAWKTGLRIKEIPIVFVDRTHGKSKMSKKIFFEALLNVWRIKQDALVDTAFSQVIRFCVVGGLGTVTNLIIFFIFADTFGMPEIPVSIGCFLIAGTQNYIINHKWSFARNTRQTVLSIKKWLTFLSGSLAGLAVNILVMTAVLAYFMPPLKFIALACGILAGMVVNFIISKFIVFRRNK
ncbi:MAG: glycosyltransferase family 2 protein [Treponema sp.]|jgi:dolichol-phosphate mannosyltransferase|nr:glycosyltransferase family 2 protein [Treponema sp.]